MAKRSYSNTRDAVVVSGWGPMCGYGQSRAALAAALGSGSGDLALAPQQGAHWFDPQPYLGKHGHKYLLHASRILWAATKVALADAAVAQGTQAQEMGVCIGTNFAVHATLRDFDETIRSVGSGGLQPMLAPNFSVNLPASVLSLKEGYQALNLTLTNPRVAGLESLIAAAGVIADGRAHQVIAGACEDGALLGGGDGVEAAACALVLERASDLAGRGAWGHARLAAHLQRFYGAPGAAAVPSDFRVLLDGLARDAAAHGQVLQSFLLSAPDSACPLAAAAIKALVEAARTAGLAVQVRERSSALTRLGCAAVLLHGCAWINTRQPLVLLECSPYGHLVALALAAMAPLSDSEINP
jgi:hypothetical protein